MELLYIHWNPDPMLFSIAGIAIRWYSIFWCIAILAGSQVVYKLYQSKGLPVDTFQNLFLYSFLGIFIGARLGHCLFYE
uniref:prolipoprotein diacylglyceryl transferase family protein n=1 Tax=Barnesiella intestinihominis TaxID=487174 RepID=UPI003970E236